MSAADDVLDRARELTQGCLRPCPKPTHRLVQDLATEVSLTRTIIYLRWFQGWVPRLDQRAWRMRGIYERGIELVVPRTDPMTDAEYDYLVRFLEDDDAE